MKMTIENNELVYIYLLDRESKIGIVDITVPFVVGDLIYDNEGFWIGLRLKQNGSFQDSIEEYKFVDEFEHVVNIRKCDGYITMRFDNEKNEVGCLKEQDFNVDIVDNKVFGIEIISWKANDLKKRKIPIEMIEYEK